MHFKLGELFCGPGGMAIASTKVVPVKSATHEEFSLSHSWGVDFSKAAIETFGHRDGCQKICRNRVDP